MRKSWTYYFPIVLLNYWINEPQYANLLLIANWVHFVSEYNYICRFWLFCCGVFPSRGIQQSACVNSGPPDRSVRGVYIPQAAVLHVFINTFLPGLSWATYVLYYWQYLIPKAFMFRIFYLLSNFCTPKRLRNFIFNTTVVNRSLKIWWQSSRYLARWQYHQEFDILMSYV